MQIKLYRILVGLMLIGFPLSAWSQSSSLNTYSPYTYYGIGDIHTMGTTATRSMGGIGVAYWTPTEINLLNPASYSRVPRQSSLLTLGVAGRSSYLKTEDSKTANNGFSFNDFGFMVPLGRGVGFAVAVTPYSSIGYRTQIEQHKEPGADPDQLVDIGHVLKSFEGDGNISQLRAGVGAQLFPGFSVGANFVAYLGTISRYSYVDITPSGADTYRSVAIVQREEVSDVSFDVGFQYDVLRSAKRVLTIGATYQPDVKLNNKHIRQISEGTGVDSIYYQDWRARTTLPQKISGGVFYQTSRLGIGMDYSYQDWSNAFKVSETDKVSLKSTKSINFGIQYTPNRLDIRRFLNRWTYRAGVRFMDMYLVKDGQSMDEIAITCGLGIPLRSNSPSMVNIGFEFGKRGKTGFTPNGFPMVKDNFFRVSLGFTLFDDNWFVKYKYN